MKQTAVDILYKFLYGKESFEGLYPYNFNQKEVFAKLKEMEKQQIIKSFKSGDCNGTFETITAEQYYNETFNK
jgi:hypothetical protein